MIRIDKANSWISTVILLLIALFGIGCGSFFVSGSALNTIAVTPTSIFLKVGETKQFTANGTTVNGDSKDVTSSATWSSSSNGVATVSAGLVTAVASGNATITASQDGVEDTSGIIVNSSGLTGITVTSVGGGTTVSAGSTLNLKATANFDDGSSKDVTSQVGWSSGDTTKATVSSSGVVTGVTASTTAVTITATVTTATTTVTGTIDITVQ